MMTATTFPIVNTAGRSRAIEILRILPKILQHAVTPSGSAILLLVV